MYHVRWKTNKNRRRKKIVSKTKTNRFALQFTTGYSHWTRDEHESKFCWGRIFFHFRCSYTEMACAICPLSKKIAWIQMHSWNLFWIKKGRISIVTHLVGMVSNDNLEMIFYFYTWLNRIVKLKINHEWVIIFWLLQRQHHYFEMFFTQFPVQSKLFDQLIVSMH